MEFPASAGFGSKAPSCPVGSPARLPSPRLLSSLRLDGAAAAYEIRRIAEAPVGGGMDTTADCAPDVAHGDQVIVRLVRSATATAEISMRYAGRVQNGFDDGTTVRKLTKASVGPLVTGPNSVYGGFSGQPEKDDMLLPLKQLFVSRSKAMLGRRRHTAPPRRLP